jgi:N-acyl homoserine lactone hydrolase
VRVESIDTVIITHLHWDHSGDNRLFKSARIIIQESELQYARSPDAAGECLPGIADLTYDVVSGDAEVARGVKVMLTPGHTHGLQGVLVEGETRRIFIASDTVPLFKNIAQYPPSISGISVDPEKYQKSLDIIMGLSAFVLPAHEFGVLGRDVYY